MIYFVKCVYYTELYLVFQILVGIGLAIKKQSNHNSNTILYLLWFLMHQTEYRGLSTMWPNYQKPKDENMGWTKYKFLVLEFILSDANSFELLDWNIPVYNTNSILFPTCLCAAPGA